MISDLNLSFALFFSASGNIEVSVEVQNLNK